MTDINMIKVTLNIYAFILTISESVKFILTLLTVKLGK